MVHEKRRQYLSKHQAHLRLVVRIGLHWFAFLLTSITVFWFWQLLLSGDPYTLFSQDLGSVFLQVAPIFVVLAALIPLFVWDTIKLSNQIICPVDRLESSLRKLAEGESVAPMSCRVTDPWQPLFQEFNRVLARLDRMAPPSSDRSDEE